MLATSGSLDARLLIRGLGVNERSFRDLKRARDVEGRRMRRVFEFAGRDFQSKHQFCKNARPLLTSSRSPGRRILYRAIFPREDTLWVDCDAMQLYKEWIADDCKGNPKFKLDVDIRNSTRLCNAYRRGTFLYAVDVMELISGSTASCV